MKIVLDTNLLIDGSSDDYNFGNRIIQEVIDGKITAYANRQTLSENRLIAKRKLTDQDYLLKLDRFFGCLNLLETRNRLNVVEDYEDNKILESAVDSESEYLVTSDNHLLKLGSYDQVKIVSPAQFWRRYEEENGSGWKNWLNDFINPA